MEVIKYIQENISWLKDISTLVFTATATIVAILTYRRARATVLQPIRSEVIKKQSELLSNFLQLLKEHDHSFDTGLDYTHLVQLNVMMVLDAYGFVFKGHKELMEKMGGEISSWIPCGSGNILKDVQIVSSFKDAPKESDAPDKYPGKEQFELLKAGVVEVDKIYLTKVNFEFSKKISEFSVDPFMPTSLQVTLKELSNDINSNLTIILKHELEAFMIEFGRHYFANQSAPVFDPVGVYNDFNHNRAHHRPTLDKLRKDIRKYLRIDESW
nr:hypothetical protein [uncultured Pedobacter sp.]